MYNDYETLYMIRQGNDIALDMVIHNFSRLIWKRSYDHHMIQKPIGINLKDLYQEGFLGMIDSIFSFNESLEVGFAFYVNLCVVSNIKTALRKCRSNSYKLLDSKMSFDMTISEDESLYLGDVVADKRIEYNPVTMSHYQEAQDNINDVLTELPILEQLVYEMRTSGYSYQEIAYQTNLSYKKVDNIIQKIRRRISNLYLKN